MTITFYVYNSFKFTKRSIIKLVHSAFVEYKMRIFLIWQVKLRVSNSRGSPQVAQMPHHRDRDKCPGVARGGGGGRWRDGHWWN